MKYEHGLALFEHAAGRRSLMLGSGSSGSSV
jgi:hypothetical protein